VASKSFRTRLEEADTFQSSIKQEADGVGADLEEMLAAIPSTSSRVWRKD
jgi:hypothetical protein